MHLIDRLRDFRDSFVMVPALFIAGGIVLAEVMVATDQYFGGLPVSGSSLFFAVGTEGARGILSAIASTVLSVATMAFSITISVMSSASSAYGPRLVRNFMSDRGNQIVLGVFTSTFLYCILVLRKVQGAEFATSGEAFIPHLAVNVAVALAVACVGVLIYFINHIANGIQVSTLATNVQSRYAKMVESLYHSERATGEIFEAPYDAEIVADNSFTIVAETSGYIIDIEYRDVAKTIDDSISVSFLPAIGNHVVEGEPLAVVSSIGQWSEDARLKTEKAVLSACSWGRVRTDYNDVLYAQEQIVELGVRSLSSGSNDPYTLTNAVHELTVVLARALQGKEPANTLFVGGEPRIQWQPVTAAQLIDAAFDGIRPYAVLETSAIMDLIEMAGRLVALGGEPHAVARARWHAAIVLEAYLNNTPERYDEQRVRELYQRYFADDEVASTRFEG
ncbi:DUF2254 domain-containing protein [Rothia sp. ZJ932]|uniref:DUF2254 domain-containing protein n=1 Tax=Rothia sp. ZJ932 TaxID=2810516 RepID=UPI0019670997|nr:DUF2254 domain-containing protein [Rothia sp. ZJ932]QRZ61038.1 DUF2254 domain-containing protein [Rothia sp. ZJ932]